MATILLSAAGAAIGGSVGGTLAGLSSVAVGRAVGATLGRVIDERLLGQGGAAVETGKVDRFRLTGAGEGEAVARLYGRMRLGGQVIWASDFLETITTTGGGKGSPPEPETSTFSYSISLAIALCEGEITSVGRVWADGEEVAPDSLNMSVYTGSDTQLPDPVMEAVEGVGLVPAYRGTAYVVMENLELGRFGNRVPQFSFEVMRPEQPGAPGGENAPAYGLRGAALIPGTGEYSLATTPVTYFDAGENARFSANIHSPSGKTDFLTSTEALCEELPNLQAASLVVCWFGSDLRCGSCELRPKVENGDLDGENMPWRVSGLPRAQAEEIVVQDGRPIYGGTPTDLSVVEAIRALKEAGKEVMFYPFILMDQLEGNDLPDPYDPDGTQPRLPWRGRITLSRAPGVAGSPDGTAAADAEVDAFFGTVTAADFTIDGDTVTYTGPEEWTLTRFILHYAALCAAAGGVEAFCISSELRGLTQIRGDGGAFYAVARLRALSLEVRSLVGPQTKISYAADWSEYFGYQPQDGSNDCYFHLDPLWADPNIDFIGIDNYMPISDWRDGQDHLDFGDCRSIYDLDYLMENIEGGEGYDWFYPSQEARDAQRRVDIEDLTPFDEPWIYRYKDIRNWWSNQHFDRIGGVRQAQHTDWEPFSKPIWFTEFGCGAIDKGTNEPNRFLDEKSSESGLPRYSSGARDDLIQMQYIRAMTTYWTDPDNNPVSDTYEGPMIDMDRAFVWAWDVRPFPFFPNNRDQWSDGENYARGHWINGRTANRSLADVVTEICAEAGLTAIDTSGLYGTVRGYVVDQVTDARSALQPLMLRHGFDAIERDGLLQFRMRDGLKETRLDPAFLALSTELDGAVEQVREAREELASRVRLRFVQADGNFDAISEEAAIADEDTFGVAQSELNMALTRAEGRQVTERWLIEARVARESLRLALPPSQLALGAGDVIELPADGVERAGRYRIDRVEAADMQIVDAVRIEAAVYEPTVFEEDIVAMTSFVAPVPVTPYLMDLPLLRGDEVPHAPYIAVGGRPWPGSVAVYQSGTDADYTLDRVLTSPAFTGVTLNPLPAACPGVYDRGPGLEVRLANGTLSSVTEAALLAGDNVAAIGDGTSDTWEIFQFGDAELIAPRTWRLSNRLRGQAGTDDLMPQVWAPGSVVVMMNGQPEQITHGPNLRGVQRHYRVGPASRSLDDASYTYLEDSFAGIGLRPYAPCHLRGQRAADAGYHFTWIRRTRINGDAWEGIDVPLGEESELYLLRIAVGGTVVREITVTSPGWHYTADQIIEDGIFGLFEVQVAQISAIFGPGLFETLTVAV
ncbi:MAG: glycoside hydrolase TIM-barrel-like domain-containing protein [Pseudomonadota bacterium]